jgi:hypothetical protein
VIAPVTVSVAVIVWLPGILSVAKNVALPLVRVELPGNTARLSVLVKWMVPAYEVAVLFDASSAVTVKLKAELAVADPGADTIKCVANLWLAPG